MQHMAFKMKKIFTNPKIPTPNMLLVTVRLDRNMDDFPLPSLKLAIYDACSNASSPLNSFGGTSEY